MNEQLKRIRQKDYISIDQKLFENMSRAENLNSTLTHLSQFQRFLMEQITIHQPSKATPISSIANSISKNFESLRQSLVNCSHIICESDKKSKLSFKKTLTSLESLIKDLKNDVDEQIKQACHRMKQETKTAMQDLILIWSKQKSLKQHYLDKCTNLQAEKNTLLKQIQRMKEANQKSSKRCQIQQQMVIPDSQILFVKSINDIQNTQRRKSQVKDGVQPFSTPLKEQIMTHITPYQGLSWKLAKEDFTSEAKRISLSHQSSSQRLQTKTQITMTKENELLVRKGVKQERGKSKQKIKLVCMM